ncbi:MAG: FesM [Chloroflexi bacterium]|nr:FesM [Chloroflexota bacterium]
MRPRPNLLQTPFLGRLLRWRWGRLVGQLLFLLVALLLLYDGFTGPPLAPENLTTVIVWVHYRGFLIFALLFTGNLFCMNCPFALPRTLARKLSSSGRRWPRRLRNKWTAVAILILYFWLYEWLDLWASPLFTVWIIVAYFVAAFILEAIFAESPFCKYVCPLGTFNFIGSTISPLQISVASQDVCQTCVGKECVNGSVQTLGCGTELFAPQIKSNIDCVFCLDCARACPHDNVALTLRHPLAETADAAWSRRWDLNLLVIIFAFTGVSNAFGMVPPIYELELWLANLLGINNEGVILFLIFAVLNLIVPVVLGLGAAWVSRYVAKRAESLRSTLARYTPAFAPMAFAGWAAHYGGFHFLSSALAIVPVFQNFLLDHGITALGQPDWTLGPILPLSWLDPIELVLVLGGFAASLYLVSHRARRAAPKPDGIATQLPWIVLLLALAIAMMIVFYLPMEMRGSTFFS